MERDSSQPRKQCRRGVRGSPRPPAPPPVGTLSQPLPGDRPLCPEHPGPPASLQPRTPRGCRQLPSPRMRVPGPGALVPLCAQTSASLGESGAQNLPCDPSQTTLPGLQMALPKGLLPSIHPSVKNWHTPFRNSSRLPLLQGLQDPTSPALRDTTDADTGDSPPNLCSATDAVVR